jgi:hypothetical protein
MLFAVAAELWRMHDKLFAAIVTAVAAAFAGYLYARSHPR